MSTKTQWPELVGMDGDQAKAVIQRERPDLEKVEVMRDGCPVTMDYRQERVRIFVDTLGKVVHPPTTG